MSEPRLDQTKEGNDKIQACPYCSARTTKSDPDFWRHIGGDCPPDQTDHYLHEVNALAHKVARAGLVWRDVPDHTPAPQDFNLTMIHLKVEYDKFMAVLAEYEELTKDGAKG